MGKRSNCAGSTSLHFVYLPSTIRVSYTRRPAWPALQYLCTSWLESLPHVWSIRLFTCSFALTFHPRLFVYLFSLVPLLIVCSPTDIYIQTVGYKERHSGTLVDKLVLCSYSAAARSFPSSSYSSSVVSCCFVSHLSRAAPAYKYTERKNRRRNPPAPLSQLFYYTGIRRRRRLITKSIFYVSTSFSRRVPICLAQVLLPSFSLLRYTIRIGGKKAAE